MRVIIITVPDEEYDGVYDNDFDLEDDDYSYHELQEQNRLDEEQDKLAREQLAREQAARPEPVIEISF